MGGTGDDVTSNDYDETVWYRFTPPADGTIDINFTSSIGHNWVLYRAPSVIVDCTNPSWSSLEQISNVSTGNESYSCLDNAYVYYIQVDGQDLPGVDVGTFTLQLCHTAATIPNNDLICGATNLVVPTNGTVTLCSQNNQCATEESGEPNVSGNIDWNSLGYDKTLWYRFTTPATVGDIFVRLYNNAGATNTISGTGVLYEQVSTVCSAGIPDWTKLDQVEAFGIANVINGSNSLDYECWELKTSTTLLYTEYMEKM
jgi:hypothetical protein